MADVIICGELKEGFRLDCERDIPSKYVQEAVFINFAHIDRVNSKILVPTANQEKCQYSVQMVLKTGKKGVLFKVRSNSRSIKGSYDKTKNDFGITEYLHKVQVLAASTNEKAKCTLDALDNGLFVVALKFSDGTIEIYGWENGISSADYTSDPQESGGLIIVPLQSDEKAKEHYLPMVYKSLVEGSEEADFEKLFEQAPTPKPPKP